MGSARCIRDYGEEMMMRLFGGRKSRERERKRDPAGALGVETDLLGTNKRAHIGVK
jgi:hypothetical protein